MIIKTLEDGARSVGELVSWMPRAAYPVTVSGLGALSLDGAWKLRNELTEIIANDRDIGMRITAVGWQAASQLADMTINEARQLRDELTTALRLAAEEELAP